MAYRGRFGAPGPLINLFGSKRCQCQFILSMGQDGVNQKS